MKFSYTHHMPYTGVKTADQDWPVPNKQFDPEVGKEIFRAAIDNKVFAEECGFDWIGNNEHHMSPYGLMPNPNLIGACVAERTKQRWFCNQVISCRLSTRSGLQKNTLCWI